MSLDTLEDLFVNVLRDMNHAEKQLLVALPRMAKAAVSPDLREAFLKHHRGTEVQVERLESIFQAFGQTPRGKRCQGMEGIVEELTTLGEGGINQAAVLAGSGEEANE